MTFIEFVTNLARIPIEATFRRAAKLRNERAVTHIVKPLLFQIVQYYFLDFAVLKVLLVIILELIILLILLLRVKLYFASYLGALRRSLSSLLFDCLHSIVLLGVLLLMLGQFFVKGLDL